MALTGLEIYKLLPKSNCGECGVPTCLAFAMKLAQKQTALDQCPKVSDEAKAALSGAAAPPIKLVTIGVGERKLELGNETVLFRHEETFHHPTGIAISVDAALPPDQLAERAKRIEALSFERVGQTLPVNLIALQGSGDPVGYAMAARTVCTASTLPMVLINEDPKAMGAALAEVGASKPLIYAATAENAEEMAALAKETGCPLSVRGQDLAETAALSEKLAGMGAAELVLDSGAREPGRVLADQTQIRRAALRKKFRPLGYPTITFPDSGDPAEQVVQASSYIAKYAGVVVLDGTERWQALPLLTVRQNIYTDPQKPIQIEKGLYQIGSPDSKSPVLVTTNFSLTYFTVEGDVEASKVPAWVVVVDTEGTSVLTSWASEKFTAETIAAMIKETGVADKVEHRKIIIPGGVSVLSGKLQELSGWQVIVGPRESSGIPTFLRSSW